jgi:hypothetical protein
MTNCPCCEIVAFLKENTESPAEALELLCRAQAVIVRGLPRSDRRFAVSETKSILDSLVFQGQVEETDQEADIDIDTDLDVDPHDKLH